MEIILIIKKFAIKELCSNEKISKGVCHKQKHTTNN